VATVQIPLTKGQCATIDEEDLPLLGHYKWQAEQTSMGDFYAVRTGWTPEGTSYRIAMHRVIAGALDGEEVDHEDGDKLNNTRRNLRRCTHAQNRRNRPTRRDNTSGYKGVHFNPKRVAHPWQTSIGTGDAREYLGCYETAEEAADAYNRAAIAKHGEFARLNVIDYDHPIPRPDVPLKRTERPPVATRKGVAFESETGKWRASIYIDGRRVALGRFNTAEEAGRAREVAERRKAAIE
jgi:hypothetical protein